MWGKRDGLTRFTGDERKEHFGGETQRIGKYGEGKSGKGKTIQTNKVEMEGECLRFPYQDLK